MYKEQDAFTKKLGGLEEKTDATKGDIQILAKNLKQIKTQIASQETLINEKLQSTIEEKTNEVLQKLIENIKGDLVEKFQESMQAKMSHLEDLVTQIQAQAGKMDVPVKNEHNAQFGDYEERIKILNERMDEIVSSKG